ncbi:MAG: hypothetical protein PHW73_02285 [Atribacterota bacterium]|nr:hypothetical protein [Atribacterota bacterium]
MKTSKEIKFSLDISKNKEGDNILITVDSLGRGTRYLDVFINKNDTSKYQSILNTLPYLINQLNLYFSIFPKNETEGKANSKGNI